MAYTNAKTLTKLCLEAGTLKQNQILRKNENQSLGTFPYTGCWVLFLCLLAFVLEITQVKTSVCFIKNILEGDEQTFDANQQHLLGTKKEQAKIRISSYRAKGERLSGNTVAQVFIGLALSNMCSRKVSWTPLDSSEHEPGD